MMKKWIKYDKWKSRVDLIPWEVLIEIWKILWHWAEKYGENNRKNLDRFESRYIGAALRHIYAHQSGELYDEETKNLHLLHALTNLIFLSYEFIKENEK